MTRRPKSPLQGGLDLLGVSDIVVLHKASEALDLVTEAEAEEKTSETIVTKIFNELPVP